MLCTGEASKASPIAADYLRRYWQWRLFGSLRAQYPRKVEANIRFELERNAAEEPLIRLSRSDVRQVTTFDFPGTCLGLSRTQCHQFRFVIRFKATGDLLRPVSMPEFRRRQLPDDECPSSEFFQGTKYRLEFMLGAWYVL